MGYVTPDFKMTRAMLCPDGRTLLVWFSRPATIGAGGNGGFSLTVGMGDLSYLAGADGIVFIFQTAEYIGPEVVGLSVGYTQPGHGVTDLSAVDLEGTGEGNPGQSVENRSEPEIVPGVPTELDWPFQDNTDSPLVINTQGLVNAGFVLITGIGESYLPIDSQFLYDGGVGGISLTGDAEHRCAAAPCYFLIAKSDPFAFEITFEITEGIPGTVGAEDEFANILKLYLSETETLTLDWNSRDNKFRVEESNEYSTGTYVLGTGVEHRLRVRYADGTFTLYTWVLGAWVEFHAFTFDAGVATDEVYAQIGSTYPAKYFPAVIKGVSYTAGV